MERNEQSLMLLETVSGSAKFIVHNNESQIRRIIYIIRVGEIQHIISSMSWYLKRVVIQWDCTRMEVDNHFANAGTQDPKGYV